MAAQPGFGRRSLLRGGLAATALGAIGLSTAGSADAAPRTPGRARTAAAGSRAAEPRIYSTAEWDARPPASEIAVLDHVPTYIVVHHTVDPGNSKDYSLKHAKQVCRDIQDFHMDSRGWADTGQQFTNTRGGFALEGRHRSLEVVRGGTQHVEGANVASHNGEVIGIENEGVYSTVDVPDALWKSLVRLVTWIAGQYNRPVKDILGHRDFNSTECPGDVLYKRLQELRDAVARQLGAPQTAPVAVWPLLRPGDAGPRVRAAQHLLRARGFVDLRADGVFGEQTKSAVVRLAGVHGVTPHVCSATRHSAVDETGYLGSDIWPLITPRVRPGGNAEIADAVGTLRRTGGQTTPGTGSTELSAPDWKSLLA